LHQRSLKISLFYVALVKSEQEDRSGGNSPDKKCQP